MAKKDVRTKRLAKLAVGYSINVKPGEQVIISGGIASLDFMIELYKEIILAGGHPIVKFGLPKVAKFYIDNATKKQIEFFPRYLMQ